MQSSNNFLKNPKKLENYFNYMKKSNYHDNVFINCPFDETFKPFFRALIFTIAHYGVIPRCSLEIDDATQLRLSLILSIIKEVEYRNT